MNFQTKIPLQPQQFNPIDYNSKVLLLGSCFSENIGEKFAYYKFQQYQNPFGILFHPLAIETLITHAVNEKRYNKNELFFHNEQWHCFEAHSRLSHVSEDQLLNNLNTEIATTHQFLKEASHIIITLGTAWAYRFIENDRLVANCHKMPQKKFLKELLSVTQITESLEAIISLIRSVNPEASFIFTVSPVRHIKDGFVENTLSKSHLIAAIHQLVAPRNGRHYFPSYEIMMDELRDYRFYKDDLVHPNTLAVNYIWSSFKKVWIDQDAEQTMMAVDEIQKGLAHRPFNSKSEAHLNFLQQLEHKKSLVNTRFSHITF
ncbi:GSCFA domain-containing protein [Psychroserpens sp. SPM9]|uniref:GSCFA domain-containing protein n=1 Tax=Psychroserpens sp. SPM9 TaxID=2975598 RepID=UPI0021A3320C|nr:GSCFA domain-containing protein [Psychroserpens sp. SPM9]MDG5492720.1 GSCFA domain-containing protein [Psychroserpens sp. SPM9]